MKLVNILLIILTVIMFSCKQEYTTKIKPQIIDFSHLDNKKREFSDYIKDYKIVPLESNDKSLISKIEKVIFKNDKYYILNQDNGYRANICIFDKNGRFLGKIDHQGRGPNEYTYIADYDILPEKDQVSVLDPLRRIIYNYSISDTNFRSFRKLNFWAKEFKYIDNNNKSFIVISTKSSKNSVEVKDMDIYVLDSNNNIVQTAFPFTKPQGVNFGNGISMQVVNGLVHYLRPNTNEIYTISSDSIYLEYVIDFPNPVLPKEKVEEFFRKGLKSDKKYTYNIIYFENANYLYSRFVSERISYHGFYNKLTKKSYIFNSHKDLSCNCGIIFSVVATTPNKFILESDIFKIDRLIKIIDPFKEKCTNPEIFTLIKKMDETSNPILLVINMNL